jgi:hypothetical protein
MPRWLWVLLGVLAVIALLIFIVANIDISTKEDGALATVLAVLKS